MALNKRKVLEAARKYAQKGAKAKALKEYNRLLKTDPGDAKLLLEVGDAYRRWGQAEEAIAQYGKVAQQYRQDGFDARAVAVFKQILNLDPKQYAAYVSLSELYQRMGLDSEAIAALQTAADGYHKEGRKTEALDLLRQTAALDPTNTTSRLKVAELLRQEGMNAEALSEYRAVAEELETQQDRDQLITIQERILELKADDVETLSSLTRNLIAAGDLTRAESFAIRALNISTEPGQYELLMEIYAQGGDDAKLADATRGLAQIYRERGDEEKVRELMQRLPTEDVASNSRLAVDVSEIDEPDLGDEELLDDEPFLALDDEVPAEDCGASKEIELELEAEEPQAGEVVEPEALPEGDPDQLLAEANVYLRYGKRDQAIASLRGVIAQDPKHRAALEKLGEAYSDDGQTAEAVDVWKRAATQMHEAGDREALAVLKDRLAVLDPAAAEQVGSVDVGASEAPEAPEIQLGLDVEVELDLDHAIDEVASSDSQSGLDFDTGGDDFEIEIDDESDDTDLETEPTPSDDAVQDAEQTTTDVSVDDDEAADGLELDVDSDDLADSFVEVAEATTAEGDGATDVEFDVDDITQPPSGGVTGQSTTTTANINEELEEAEFYRAQEMFDEAKEILTRVLELVPNHPSAMLRMGEIEAAQGAEPDDASGDTDTESMDEDSAEATLEQTANDFEVTARLGENGLLVDAEIDVDLDVDIDDVDENEAEDEDDTFSDTASDESSPVEADSPDASTSGVDEVAETNDETSGSEDPDECFDLREALADVLSDDEDSASGVLSTVEDGFGSIFSDFKKGVSEALEDSDFETRYDLGIAYREMGLHEDAIGEFRVCLDSPERRFDSLYLMGLCTRELSRFDDSINHFEQALADPDIPVERQAGVYFDLSISFEKTGDLERARSSLQKVIEIDADFPGASERLAALDSGTTAPTLSSPGEEFESFDELFEDEDDEGGDVAMVEAVPEETFESFDDVIEEAEAVFEAEETAPDQEPDSDSDTASGKKSGRKRISFV